jgi:D-alanine transaminase
MTETVYLNGQYLAKEAAHISPFDRGFLFGDAIYEVTPIYDQVPFRITAHFQRLQRNTAQIGIKLPISFSEFEAIVNTLLQQPNRPEPCLVYFQVSRGTPNQLQRNHRPTADLTPTIFACLQPREVRTESSYAQGFKAILSQDLRWHCTHIKATSLLANILHIQQAQAKQTQEAILHANGHLTEGASSNIFLVQKGTLLTPTTQENILPGITRQYVLELAKKLNIPVKIQPCPLTLLDHCDELLITSSTREVMPIVQVNDHIIGHGTPGPVWQKLFRAYQKHRHLPATVQTP